MKDVCRVLYRHRELIGVLVLKQIRLRYRGSVLGFCWTLLNPLALMVVYTLVFSVYLRVDVEAYPAFLFTGLLPWIWFASSLQQAVTSILDGAPLVTRSQFPAEVLPVVALTANTVNFLLSVPLLFGLLLLFGIRPARAVLWLPALVALEYLLILGLVLLVSALNVYYRDLQHILLHALALLLFLTPVFYPASLIPPAVRPWALLNPLGVLISAFQDVLFFGRTPPALPLLGLFVFACLVLGLGTGYFNRQKATFAEAL
jgi:ABC-type polysaccharide/polyol phosphate export permease